MISPDFRKPGLCLAATTLALTGAPSSPGRSRQRDFSTLASHLFNFQLFPRKLNDLVLVLAPLPPGEGGMLHFLPNRLHIPPTRPRQARQTAQYPPAPPPLSFFPVLHLHTVTIRPPPTTKVPPSVFLICVIHTPNSGYCKLHRPGTPATTDPSLVSRMPNNSHHYPLLGCAIRYTFSTRMPLITLNSETSRRTVGEEGSVPEPPARNSLAQALGVRRPEQEDASCHCCGWPLTFTG